MKGMIVKSNLGGKQDYLEVGLPDGLVDAMVNITRYEGAYWTVGGLKMPEEIHLTWAGGNLTLGDEIEIEIVDVDKSASCVHEESHASLKKRMIAVAEDENDPILWKRKLEHYYRLKAILEDENLIENY